MVNETRKMLHREDLGITATTVRVPVMRCDSESVYVELKKDLTLDEVRKVLSEAKGVQIQDDIENKIYPIPLFLKKKHDIYVGRIRTDLHNPRDLNLWLVGDQVRKGAPLNAVQIGEILLAH